MIDIMNLASKININAAPFPKTNHINYYHNQYHDESMFFYNS